MPTAPTSATPRRSGRLDAFFRWLRGLGLVRRRDGRWVAGVCNGVAQRVGVDPILVRAGFVLVLVFGGFGLPVYLLLWALLPSDGGQVIAEDPVRRGGFRRVAFLVVVALVVAGSLGGRWWVWSLLLPLAFVTYVVLRHRGGSSRVTIGHEVTGVATHLGDRVSDWVSGGRAGGVPGGGSGGESGGEASGQPGAEATSAAGQPVPLGATGLPGGTGLSGATGQPGTPYGMGPGRTGAVAAPSPPAPRVVQRRRPRGGLLGLLLAVGLAVVGYAVGLHIPSVAGVGATVAPEPVALAGALAGVGLALLVIGLMGRRAGVVGLLAVLFTLGVVGHTVGRPGFVTDGVGDATWVVAQHPGQADFRLGVGDSVLDLTGASAGASLSVHQGVGDVRVVVPSGVTATVNASVGAGSIHIDGSSHEGDDTGAQSQTFVVGTGATDVAVDVHLTVGDLTVEKGA